MTNLLNLQNDFQNYLLEKNTDFENEIISTEKVAATTRLTIYRNAYRLRLVEALASNYPILNTYLGTTFFEKMALAYLDKHPSCNKSIRWFGHDLVSFLNHHKDYQSFSYLSELAAFEWKMTLVFDAADSKTITMTDIAEIPIESWVTMQLTFHPSLERLDCLWNAIPIWKALSDDEIPEQPVKNPSKLAWVLWRKDLMNQFYSLTEDEAWAMDAVLSQLNFGEICEGLCQFKKEEEVGMHAAMLLKKWVQSDMIAKVSY